MGGHRLRVRSCAFQAQDVGSNPTGRFFSFLKRKKRFDFVLQWKQKKEFTGLK